VGRARRSGTNSSPARDDGPRVPPVPVVCDGCTAPPPVVVARGGSCCTTVRDRQTIGPAVGIRRKANTVTT